MDNYHFNQEADCSLMIIINLKWAKLEFYNNALKISYLTKFKLNKSLGELNRIQSKYLEWVS